MTHDAYIVEPGKYFVLDRVWHYRVGLEDQDWGAIHENWLGDPYHIAGSLSGATVLDIGGNIGTFALRALKEGAREVMSFEPEPDNARLFRLNCAEELRAERIILDQFAIWPEDENGVNHDMQMVQAQGASAVQQGGSVLVPTLSLTKALRMMPGKVHFLKMDIEGGEIQNLAYVDPLIFTKVERIAMEYHGYDPRFGLMIRNLSAMFDLEINGTEYPGHMTNGMLFGRNHNA